jgi:hypothetical protein
MSRPWIATALLCAMMLPFGAFAAGDDDENER